MPPGNGLHLSCQKQAKAIIEEVGMHMDYMLTNSIGLYHAPGSRVLVEGLQQKPQWNRRRGGDPSAHAHLLGYARQQGAHAQAREYVPALSHGPKATEATLEATRPRTGA